MKTLFATATAIAMLAAVSTSASAYAKNTSANFEQAYNLAVKEANDQGVNPEVRCWKGYCTTTMTFTEQDGAGFVGRTVFDNGVARRQVCFTPLNTPNFRICSYSDGKVVTERFDGQAWQIAQVAATAFEE